MSKDMGRFRFLASASAWSVSATPVLRSLRGNFANCLHEVSRTHRFLDDPIDLGVLKTLTLVLIEMSGEDNDPAFVAACTRLHDKPKTVEVRHACVDDDQIIRAFPK